MSPFLVEHLDRGAAYVRDVAFFEEHEATRDRQQRGNVGGHEVFVDPEANDDRATFARQDNALGLSLAHHGQRVRAFELGDRGAHRLEQIFLRGEMMMHAMRDHLGVGFRRELVAQLLQIRAQLFVVLDDAVVHDREAVMRHVRDARCAPRARRASPSACARCRRCRACGPR